MLGSGLLAWVRRRDPGYVVLRRAARLTLVASAVFYGGRYGLGNPTLATYGLFGAVAMGAFTQLPGAPRERARILLVALPVGWVLISLGTVLAGNVWAAAGGMLVVGFVVAFAGTGGPRLVGLVGALQLFYILASFPPYQPDTLPQRLLGVTIAVLLLAVTEVLLFPDPPPVSYPQRLVSAADRLAVLLDVAAEMLAGTEGDQRERLSRQEEAAAAVARLRLAEFPAAERPTSAVVRDRALRACEAALQGVLVKVTRILAEAPPQPPPGLAAARLFRACAETTRASGRTLRHGGPPVSLDDLDAAIDASERAFAAPTGPVGPADLSRLCLDAGALSLANQVSVLAVSARAAVGLPTTDTNPAVAGYRSVVGDVRQPRWRLYWRQFRAHLTVRSALFQSAVRLAVALSAARVVAGFLPLQHGFWVLLATLTVLRTSAMDTRTALKPAVLGTIGGAAASGVLMLFVNRSIVYVVALPVTMVLAFTLGRLLGPSWAQALFTLLLTFVFAQLAPAGPQLAETRLVNVLIGAAVGILAGVLLWPRGARHDLRKNTAGYLRAVGGLIEEAVAATLGGPRPDEALHRARRAVALADASYAQYHGERHDPPAGQVDWQAVLSAGHHALHAVPAMLFRYQSGRLADWPEAAAQLRETAGRIRSAYDEVADQITRGEAPHPVVSATRCIDELNRFRPLLDERSAAPQVRHLVEVNFLLANLADHIAHTGPSTAPRRDGPPRNRP
ncbi:FUSC family protein [Micromonospora sp. 15K316]|uniref:FUSC family protein n=1 Tax=Micromonospora sp. 15K316 TaxID=2530376 RepID=UPI00104ABEA7|nr:FUSC family protein [Micromonospora sp. 15K316]TDC40055.1 FUSC family protein [Micromonospora sp. 15K316]